jgi:hypothetical protein
MCDPKEVFKALPHVNTIWVTDDGHFHLHPHNGGEEINRDEELPIVEDNGGEEINRGDELPIVDNGGESLKEDKPRSKGRPKNK